MTDTNEYRIVGRSAALCGKWFLLVAGLLSIVGCGAEPGPQRAAAAGKVSLDGAPLAEGVVRFVPAGATQGPVAVATVKDGAFHVSDADGPVVGTHRVEIETLGHWGFAVDDEVAFVEHFEQQPLHARPKNPIPGIYNRHSTLTAEILPDGPNEFEFQLRSSSAGG